MSGIKNPLVHLFCQTFTFAAGFSLAYSEVCPDDDTLYEVMPVWKQRDYIYVSFHNVPKCDYKIFEEVYKGCVRTSQQQPGYLNSKLYRSVNPDSTYNYIGLSTYVDPGSQHQITSKIRFMDRWDKLPGNSMKSPFIFKSVVNDSEYVPMNMAAAYQSAF